MENVPSIYIMDYNDTSSEVLKSYLEESGYTDIKIFSDYINGLKEIKNNPNNPLVFLNLDNANNDEDNVLISLKLLTNRIVVLSTDYSTDNIIKALRNGAKDFLPKPVLKNELLRAVNNIIQHNDSMNETSSKIITIYSNKGGIGKTTIATNLAVELAKTTGEKVALIDLNLHLGDVSTFLNLNPAFDVTYAIKKLVEKEEILLNAFTKYKNLDLYILSDSIHAGKAENITPQQIETLFNGLKKVFPYIIIDLSSSIDPNSLKILDKSDIILFTTIVNIPAIRNAQKCLTLFKSRDYSNNKVKIIINRYMENDEIKIEDIETTLDEKIYWKIPNNYFSIMEAINKGISVSEVNSNSNIANSFKDLSIKIADDIIKQTVLDSKGDF